MKKTTKKILTLVLAVVMMIGCISTQALAMDGIGTETDLKVKTSVASVVLYQSKLLKSANKVTNLTDGKLPVGTFVQIESLAVPSSASLAGRTWVGIKYADPTDTSVSCTGYACIYDGTEIFDDIVFYEGHMYEKSIVKTARVIRESDATSSAQVARATVGSEILIEGVYRISSTGNWVAVKYFTSETESVSGYIYMADGAEYLEDFALANGDGSRVAYANGTTSVQTYGDKTPVYGTKSTKKTPVKLLEFGEQIAVKETVLLGSAGTNYWWVVEYTNDAGELKTGYCYQAAGKKPVLTYINTNTVESGLSTEQTTIRANAAALHAKGSVLQYNASNRLMSTSDGDYADTVNTIFNTTSNVNIDCSSFAYAVYYQSLDGLCISNKTYRLINYGYAQRNTSIVKTFMSASAWSNYYDADTLTVDTTAFANDVDLEVGDMIVTWSTIDGSTTGHAMLVDRIQYDANGNIKNVILVQSTGSSSSTESYGSVIYQSLDSRFVGEKHTTSLNYITVITPTEIN